MKNLIKFLFFFIYNRNKKYISICFAPKKTLIKTTKPFWIYAINKKINIADYYD